jgi:hypothetical protein
MSPNLIPQYMQIKKDSCYESILGPKSNRLETMPTSIVELG